MLPSNEQCFAAINMVLFFLFIAVVIASMQCLLIFIMGVLICFQLTVVWKVVEKVLYPTQKQSESSPIESQSASQGVKWSFAAGTNLFSQLGAKIERQSKQTLNEFARELRSFPSIDMSGMLAVLI